MSNRIVPIFGSGRSCFKKAPTNCRAPSQIAQEAEVAEALWQKNLADAILLNPMVLLYGNIKDRFSVHAGNEDRLPASLRSLPYVNFPTWLALMLERLGFGVVIVYDPADGAI